MHPASIYIKATVMSLDIIVLKQTFIDLAAKFCHAASSQDGGICTSALCSLPAQSHNMCTLLNTN